MAVPDWEAARLFLAQDPSDKLRLLEEERRIALFALEAQAINGPCPHQLLLEGTFTLDPTLRKRQDAWKALGQMPSSQAQAKFVQLLTDVLPQWRSSINLSPEDCAEEVQNEALQSNIDGEDFTESAAQIDYLKSRLLELKSSLPELFQRINNCMHELEPRMKKLEKLKDRVSWAEDLHDERSTRNIHSLRSSQEIRMELGLPERD